MFWSLYAFNNSGRTYKKPKTQETCGAGVVPDEWEEDTLLLPFVLF